MGTLIKKFEILIDGFKQEEYNILDTELVQNLLSPNVLSFTIQNKDVHTETGESNFPLPKKLMGEKVSFTVVTVRFNEQDQEVEGETLEFEGIIFRVNIRRRAHLFTEQLIDVQACSPDFLLNDHAHCISYENDDLKKIVSETLDPYNIPNSIDPRMTEVIPYTVQYNETNYQFLKRLAQRYGEWMYNDGTKWIFGKVEKKDPVNLEPRNDILNYSFQVNLVHHKLKHAHHDYLKYENPVKIDSDFSDLTQSGYHELTDMAKEKATSLFTKETFQHLQCSNPEDNDTDEHEVSAKAQLFGEKTQQVVCTGSSVRADLTIGSIIEVYDHFVDDASGNEDSKHKSLPYEQLIITGIVHTAEEDGEYSNRFTAYPANSEYPPYYNRDVFPPAPPTGIIQTAEGVVKNSNPFMAYPADSEYPSYNATDIFPFAQPQRAKVMENQDPEKLGRIRVQFLWQEKQDPNLVTPWIRIAQPHGGDDKGFYFIPEIDEEVMVDFENGNAEKPYVVGTLYHGKQKPGSKWPNETNDIKAIRTRNGHTVEIHDKGKNGYIKIYDHQKNNYVLTFSTDEKLIKLQSSGNIELHAKKDIIMKAGNDMKIEVGNDKTVNVDHNIKIESGCEKEGYINIKANGKIGISASDDLEQSSGKEMTLGAKRTNIYADGSMNIISTGINTIKGSQVLIN